MITPASASAAPATSGRAVTSPLPRSVTSPNVTLPGPTSNVHIVNVHSHLCLNVYGASKSDGAPVIQYHCTTNHSNDRWNIVENPYIQGDYWIKNVNSGLCLNVEGGSIASEAPVIQYTCTNTTNAIWHFPPPGPRGYQILNDNSRLCLNVKGASLLDGAPVIQYGCTNQDDPYNLLDNDVWTIDT